MRSFALFALVATGFSAIASAMPLAARTTDIQSTVAGAESKAVSTAGHLSERCGCETSLVSILANVQAELEPHITSLYYCNSQNATVDVVTGVVAEVKVVLNAAIVDVTSLVGVTVDELLLDVDGVTVLTVSAFANIVGGLFVWIFAAIGVCLKVCVNVGAILSILAEVGVLVGHLLCAVLSLVDGLVAEVVVLLTGVFGIIIQLNITALITVFNISV